MLDIYYQRFNLNHFLIALNISAFDIAGTGTADVKAMTAAFDIACNMVSNWQ